MSETVRFGRLERRGVALGRSGAELALIGTGVLVAIGAVYGGGMAGLAVTAPVWLVACAAGLVRVRGRGVPAWAPIVTSWVAAHALGRTRAARVPTPAAELTLPGIRRPLALAHCPALSADLVVDLTSATVTGALRVRGTGFVLDDAATREHKSAAWGRLLGGLCAQPQVLRVQVLTALAPGGLSAPRRWWRDHTARALDGPAAALGDLLDATFAEASRREHLIVFAVRNPRGRRRPDRSTLDQLAGTFASLAAAVEAADLVTDGWLDAAGVRAALRRGLDPWSPDDIDVRAAEPAGVLEAWDCWCTGTTWHATFWIAEWPRTAVDATFLQPLVVGTDAVRTVSLVAEPVPVAEALRAIRRARAEHRADAAQRDRLGQVEEQSTLAEVDDLDRREAELVAGHGDLRFSGLITVSATTSEALDAACRSLASDAARAMCDLVRLVGQQGAAHLACALPLARGVR